MKKYMRSRCGSATIALTLALASCQNYNLTRSRNQSSPDGAAEFGPALPAAPNPPTAMATPGSTSPAPVSQPAASPPTQTAIEVAAAGAPSPPDESDAEQTAEYRRNSKVGQFLLESDKLCGEYLQDLTRTQRGYGLLLGSLATIFGAAGSAFTHASVVRPLAALASISSGERAEFDADLFAKQTAQVIISAIKSSRARAYNTIVLVDFQKSVKAWPLSVALADVQDYHSRCSLNEGISEAAASISGAQVTPATNPAGGSAPGDAPAPRTVAPPSAQADKAVATTAAASSAGLAVALTKGATPLLVANAVSGALGVTPSASPTPTQPAHTLLPSPSAADASSVAKVASIQLALAKFQNALAKAHQLPVAGDGAETVTVDGLSGSVTASALRLFQEKTPGLTVTGNPDPDTLTKLGVTAVAPAAPVVTSSAGIKLVQQKLRSVATQLSVALSPTITDPKIPLSGVVDAPTIAALIAYQDKATLPLTGVIDNLTYQGLSKL